MFIFEPLVASPRKRDHLVTHYKIWELRMNKFKLDFLVVMDRVHLVEVNDTIWDPIGAKFLKLQRI